MKKSLIITGLSLSLVAGLLTTISQPVKADNDRNRKKCGAVVLHYASTYTQGRVALVYVAYGAGSPGSPEPLYGEDLPSAIAALLDAGYEMQPQTVFGELFFIKR